MRALSAPAASVRWTNWENSRRQGEVRPPAQGAVWRVMGVTQPAFPSSLLSLPSASASPWAQHSILSCTLALGCPHHPVPAQSYQYTRELQYRPSEKPSLPLILLQPPSLLHSRTSQKSCLHWPSLPHRPFIPVLHLSIIAKYAFLIFSHIVSTHVCYIYLLLLGACTFKMSTLHSELKLLTALFILCSLSIVKAILLDITTATSALFCQYSLSQCLCF